MASGESGSIGQLVRRFRRQRGMTLRELADLCGVSASYLSRLERGSVGVSVACLRRLSEALRVPVSSLLMEGPQANLQPVRRGQGFIFKRHNAGSLVVEEFLHMHGAARMQPEVMFIPAGSDSGEPLAHLGEEFLYVLSGCVGLQYGGQQELILEEGDSVYFDSTVPHRYRNPDLTRLARVLVVCSPPSF
ncbi:MAG: helix-turn-helix domain-containing protein [Bacillota bacterium]|nr:helix-turn-helix domain-containing protein [Bacillota bacterium]